MLFFHIEAFTREETALYVQHRLRVSGAREPLFSPAAIDRIHAYTGGNPRTINLLCDRALLTGYVTGAYHINEKIISECAREFDLRRKRSTPVFLNAVNQMRACGGALLRRTATVGAEMKPKIKTAIEYLPAWLHAKGKMFVHSVSSRLGRFMALQGRHIVIGLSVSAVTFLFATWTLYAFSGADDQDPNITLKRPNAADVKPAPTDGEWVQMAASRHQDMSSKDAAESASSSSKPAARTSKEKSSADKDAAPAPDSYLPDRAMLSDRANTGEK